MKGIYFLMAKEQTTSMQIVTREDENVSRGGSRGLSDKVELVTKTLNIDKLKQSWTKFVSGLQSMVDAELDETSPFQLNEIQFSAEITASGEFKLLGTGVGVQGSSTITFVLQRRTPEK
jgi:hypothetical protein